MGSPTVARVVVARVVVARVVVARVVVLGGPAASEAAASVLPPTVEIVVPELERDAVAAALTEADALLDASMKVPITDEMVAGAPRLRIVACATTGSDHVQRGELDRRGIPVRTLREDPDLLAQLTPAAELSWALVLACARRLVAASAHVRGGGWDREQFPGVMLRGRRLGLLGCGRIGQWMARYGAAFGMEVIGHDPYVSPWPAGITAVGTDELFARSDVLSVHVHLSDETRGLVSRRLLASMPRGAIVVNTSRGAVVDESALLDLLVSGHLGGAGLDAIDGEPDVVDHPLVAFARAGGPAVITPHMGGYSPDAVRVVCARSAEKIRDALGINRLGVDG